MTPLVVGVTGHRVLAETDRLAAGIERALDALERRDPGRPLVVLSALAEGADRLVAERVLARPHAALRAVLPFPRAEYEVDFNASGSRQRFAALLARAGEVVELPARHPREAAYEAAGRYVVDHSDALLAVWDGAPAQGRGGTAAIVAYARARRRPLAWVHAGVRRPGPGPAGAPGSAQGRLIMENL